MSVKFEEVADGVFVASFEFKKGGVTSICAVEADTDEEVLTIAVGPKGRIGYNATQEQVFYGPVAYELSELLAVAADLMGNRRRRGGSDS